MNNHNFLQKIEELQLGIMHKGSTKFPFGEYFYGIEDKSSFWNHLLTDRILSVTEIKEVEKYAMEKKLKSAVYFENRPGLKQLEKILINNNYTEAAEDSWMFIDKKIVREKQFDSVKKVETEEDLKIYLKTIDDCYQNNDPQNVYGELGDYLVATKRSWIELHESNKLEYFTVFDGNEAVAVSALTNYNGIGYISNVGSLKKVRGRGFGKLATMYTVYQSQNNGNSDHCLATEENTYANEFYKKIGFETKFTALLFEKSKS